MKVTLGFFISILVFSVIEVAKTEQVICYFGSWSKYRPGKGNFKIENIDSNLCTIIIYSFVGLRSDGSINPMDAGGDLANFKSLRTRNENVKLLVAIGGWNEGSQTYSQVVASASLRSTFVNNVVNFVKVNLLDGFDLDWEYPGQRGGGGEDKANYVALLSDLRPKFDENKWLLTAAVGASEYLLSSSYDVPQLSRYLDYINLMTYDFHGGWDTKVGFNSPLYSSPADNTKLNQDAAVQIWINAGADPKKIVLGLAAYGRSYNLANPNQNTVGAPVTGTGPAGPYSREAGMLTYLEVCEKLKSGDYTEKWDDDQKCPYAFKNTEWIGYDNAQSITIKTTYAKTKGLAGVMIWSIESEDHQNVCGGGAYPLLNAVKKVFEGFDTANNNPQPEAPTQIKPSKPNPPTTPGSNENGNTNNGSKLISIEVATRICKLRKNGSSFANPPRACTTNYYRCFRSSSNEYLAFASSCHPVLRFDDKLGFCNYPEYVDACNQTF